MRRSAGAVLVGFLTWTALWLVGNAVLRGTFASRFRTDGSTEDGGLLLAILALSVGCSIGAGG